MDETHPKEVVERLLAGGDTMLCVDSRHPEVRVPDNHRGRADLRLVLNLGFRHPIHVLEEGVQADLLFAGRLHHCWVPYESLWGAYNPDTGEGMVWPDRIPAEIAARLSPGASPEPDAPRTGSAETEPPRPGPARKNGDPGGKPGARGRPALRLVPGGRKKPGAG